MIPESNKPQLVDLGKFPDGWVKPNVFIPTIDHTSTVGKIRRSLVVTAFPADRYQNLPWLQFNRHERWVAAVNRWLKNVGVARAVLAGKHPVIEKRLKTAGFCRAPGYKGDPRRGKIGTRCDNRLCPFCHARRGVEVFDRLQLAYNKVPHADPVYIGLVSYSRKKGVTNLEKELRKRKVAAGSGIKYPIAVEDGRVVWAFKVIVLADNKTSVKGIPHFTVTGRGGLALAVTKWFTYPAIWSSPSPKLPDSALLRALHITAEIASSPRIILNFGACRAGHDSTKSTLGFKLSPLQVDFLLKRKDPLCPQRSPPSGSSETPCSTSPSQPNSSDPVRKTPPPQS